MKSKSPYFGAIALALAIGPSAGLAKDAGAGCFEGASTQSQMTDCSAARAEENRRKMQENAHEIKRRISNIG